LHSSKLNDFATHFRQIDSSNAAVEQEGVKHFLQENSRRRIRGHESFLHCRCRKFSNDGAVRRLLLVTFLAPLMHLTAADGDGRGTSTGFFLPSYGTGGELIWQASGSEAIVETKSHKMLLYNPVVSLFAPNDGHLRPLVFESTSAEFDGDSGRMDGDDIVHIIGSGFTAIGSRWTFSGNEKKLHIDGCVQTFFEADQTNGPWQRSGDGFTVTAAGGLTIESCDGTFVLRFLGPIGLKTQNYLLCCDELTVEIPSGCSEKIFGKELSCESFRTIQARGNVRMDDPDRHITADEVRIFCGEDGAVILSGNVTVVDGDEEVRGQRVLIRGDRQCILATGASTDASPILDID
jgi:hypothetical protein